jgi:hypothetical protein
MVPLLPNTYKCKKPVHCANRTSGTKVVVVLGSGGASFTQRRTTDADITTPPR